MSDDKPQNYDRNFPNGKLYIEDEEEYIAPVDVMENNGDISPVSLKENYEQINLNEWENYHENNMPTSNRQALSNNIGHSENSDIPPLAGRSTSLGYKKHDNIQKQQDLFSAPDLNILAGEYDKFSSDIDKKLDNLGLIGSLLKILKKIAFTILGACGLVLAVIMLCIFLVGYATSLLLGGIIGTIYSSIVGTMAFILNRIISFIIVTAVLIIGFNYFWKMNPEFSRTVDEYKHKIRMYSQKYLGGFSLPKINTFDDVIESSLDSIGLGDVDTSAIKNLKIPSINVPNFGEITGSTSLKDILPTNIVKQAIPSELAPIMDVAGDPTSVANIANLLSGGIAPQKLDKAVPVLKNVLMTTNSNEMRSAVLKSLKNIDSPVTNKVIKDYEVLINRSVKEFGIK